MINATESSTRSETLRLLTAIFSASGQVQPSGANHPFRLDEGADVFLVMAGQVDLFAVHEAEGETGKQRNFLCAFPEGTLLFGADLASQSAAWSLTGFGSLQSQVQRMTREALIERVLADGAGDLIFEAYAQFFATLSEAASLYPKPQFSVLLDKTEAENIKPGVVVGIQSPLVWVEHRAGRSAFVGYEDMLLQTDGTLFPLPKGFWLEVQDEGAQLAIVPPDAARLNDFISAGDRLMGFFSAWTQRKMTDQHRQDLTRLQRRHAFEDDFFEGAIDDISKLMEADQKTDQIAGDPDPVFAAFRAVGEKVGVEFRRPPRWQSPWLLDGEPTDTETIRGNQFSDPIQVITQFSKLRYRKVLLADVWWETDNGPLIAYLDPEQKDSHQDPRDFARRIIALLPRKGGGYDFYDPRDGSSRLVGEEEAGSLEPTAYMFYRPFLADKLAIPALMRFVYKDVLGDFRDVFLVGLAGFVLGLINPMITAHLFNTVIPTADRGQLLEMTGVLLVAAFAGILFNATQGWAMLRIETKINSSLQASIFDRILKLPLPFFRQYAIGDLAIRSTGINRIRQALSGATLSSIMTSLSGMGNLIMLFYYSNEMISGPQGTGGVSGVYLLIVAGIAIIIVNMSLTAGFAYYSLQYQRRVQEVSGRIASLVNQLLSAIPKLRVAGMEGRAFALWSARFRESNRLSFYTSHLGNYVQIYNIIIPTLSSITFYWLISYIVGDKPGVSVVTGSFLAFFAAFTTFMGSLTTLASTLMGLVNIVPAYERSRPLIETPCEVDVDKPDPGQLSGHIQVSHVSFRYKEDGPLILNDVSFEIQPGDFVAFVGPSGSGKSTTMRVLLGFEDPETGGAFFDGQELASVDVTAVRRQIGVVSQQSGVLSGSILQNILGASSLTLEDAWEAARMAGFEEDVRAMPMGMHTVVSEGGSTLSGGQRQRLLIARALVNKPRILFFDEATSALDNRTQQIVTDSLEKLNATRLVIAHRLSTIQHADRIYVMTGGRIVQSGSFEALMAEPGLFADLAARQVL